MFCFCIILMRWTKLPLAYPILWSVSLNLILKFVINDPSDLPRYSQSECGYFNILRRKSSMLHDYVCCSSINVKVYHLYSEDGRFEQQTLLPTLLPTKRPANEAKLFTRWATPSVSNYIKEIALGWSAVNSNGHQEVHFVLAAKGEQAKEQTLCQEIILKTRRESQLFNNYPFAIRPHCAEPN